MDKKNRILCLLHIPPPIHGSSIVGKTIKESKMINKDFDCRYINLLASNNLAETGKIKLRKVLNFTFNFIEVLVSLIKHRPYICYFAITATGAAFYKDVILVTLLKIFRIKRVYHLHNKGFSKHQNNPIDRFCKRFVFNDAEVILLSRHLYFDIKQFVLEDKVHICPYGIANEIKDLDAYASTDEYNVLSSKKPIQILFLSNLIESKGVFILLEACEILKKKGIPFECVYIGGEGDITASRFNEKVKQLDLIEQVTYKGKKYGDEKNQAFSEADIFAFPTYYHNETYGLVNLEAMQHSLPIISTFEGGIPDIVEDGITGFLVPQRNVEALAEKLEVLIKSPALRKRMGEAGWLKYEQKFTLEIFEKRMVQILQKVIYKKLNHIDIKS